MIGPKKRTKGYDLNFGPEAYGDGYSDPMAGQDGPLIPCSKCDRTFNAEALKKHQKICVKVFKKQRKVFDSAKHRIVEPEQIQLMRKGKMAPKGMKPTQTSKAPVKSSGGPSKWEIQSA